MPRKKPVKIDAKGVQIKSEQKIDRKTKQVILFECDIDTIKRQVFKSREEFSQDSANVFFEKYKKRQSKGHVFCLMDRMRFERRGGLGPNPFRKELTYREITKFLLFPNDPRSFMLCTLDEKCGKCAYEIYQCKPEDVISLCNLTYVASKSPQRVINEWDPEGCSQERELSSSVDSDFHESTPVDQDEYSNSFDTIGERNEVEPSDPEAEAMKQFSEAIQLSDESPTVAKRYLSKSHYNLYQTSQVDHVYSCYEYHSPNETTPNYSSWQPRGRTRPGINFVDNPGTSRSANGAVSTPPFITKVVPLLPTERIGTHKTLTAESFPRQPISIHRETKVDVVPKRKVQYDFPPVVNGSEPKHRIPSPQNYRPIKIIREYSTNEVQQELRRARSTLDLRWGEDVTYITPNAQEGTTVSEEGPVYIYVSRFRSQLDVRPGTLKRLEQS